MFSVAILVLLGISNTASTFVSYDCSIKSPNVTKVSLTKVSECQSATIQPAISRPIIQLLQRADYQSIHVKQCKITITRQVGYCGMHSHYSALPDGVASYVHEISREQCLRAHSDRSLLLFGNIRFNSLASNSSRTETVAMAGVIRQDGSCEGSPYRDQFGHWDKAIVQGSVTITLVDYTASATTDGNSVILSSGVRCRLAANECMDMMGGQTFWDSLPSELCGTYAYEELYHGPAERAIEVDHLNVSFPRAVYSLISEDITFALVTKSTTMVCGYKVYLTEHPRLFVVENGDTGKLPVPKRRDVKNLDLTTYVNAKIVYTERHIRTQITSLYRRFMLDICRLERKVLYNSLNLALSAPDQFASNIMQAPGYMAYLGGEVIYITKCLPVETKIREPTFCTQDIPITHNNQSVYSSRVNHVIIKHSVEVPCSRILPVMYSINGAWVQSIPQISVVPGPGELSPDESRTWKYESPGSLASSGIYGPEEIETMRELIMFPMNSPAITNQINRKVSGLEVVADNLEYQNLLNENMIDKLSKTMWDRIRDGFSSFGIFSAGVIGVVMALKLVKLGVDTFIHGYALHKIYGWSIMLLCAVWDSLTNFLLHRAAAPPNAAQAAPPPAEAEPLQEVVHAPRVEVVYGDNPAHPYPKVCYA